MQSDLKIFSSTAMYSIFQELLPRFNKETGVLPSVIFDSSNMILDRVHSGEVADVIILTNLAIDRLAKEGKVASNGHTNIAKSGMGIVVRSGTTHPDISSVRALKNTLMHVNSIAYTTTGASGVYFTKLINILGLAEQLKDKLITPKGGHVAKIVASGDAEIGVQLTSELLGIPGVEYVGNLPVELQMNTIFIAAIFSNTGKSLEASKFIHFLSLPDFSPIYKQFGMEFIGTS